MIKSTARGGGGGQTVGFGPRVSSSSSSSSQVWAGYLAPPVGGLHLWIKKVLLLLFMLLHYMFRSYHLYEYSDYFLTV